MAKKIHSIHILNSDIDRVSLCLSNCQMTNKNSLNNRVTSYLKETTATFYILQAENVISVFSTYFDNNFNIKEIGRWFAGENSHVFLLDYFEDTLCKVEVFKKYKFLTPLILQNNMHGIKQNSLFKLEEIGSAFQVAEKDLNVELDSIEEYLLYYSSLLKIPLYLSPLDIMDNPNTESISFYI